MLKLLWQALPYLRTLLNLYECRVTPCMSKKNADELKELIDSIWQLVREYDKENNDGQT